MRVYLIKQMFAAAGALGMLAGGVLAAPPPSTSAPTVAQPSANVTHPASASSAQFFGSSSGIFPSTTIGPTHPDYWSGTYNFGGNYGSGGVLSPGYWFPVRPGSAIVAGGVQSAGAPPKGAIVAGPASAGLHFAGAAPSGVIVAGGPTGATQSAGAAPSGVIVAGGPAGGTQPAGTTPAGAVVAGASVGGTQSAGGVIVSGGTSVGTNAAQAKPH